MQFLKRHFTNLGLILALSVFAWSPLLTTAYFFKAHDARHSVFYVVEFDQTFRDGYWWPRWSPDFAFGYGYPLFNIYAPLAIYAAEIVHLLGLSFTDAVKTMYILATLMGGFGMYGFVRRLFGDSSGLLAALVYIYAPFHLVEIFVRSAYAEFVALAVIPFVFWAFTELLADPNRRRVASAGFTYGLLILTHHTTFFTFTPLLMVYILYFMAFSSHECENSILTSENKIFALRLKRFIHKGLYALAAGFLGAALSAIYLLPTLVEKNYIKVEQWTSGSYNYLDHFVYFSQFFSPMWGYGYAGVGLADGFSYQLGIVGIVLVSFAMTKIYYQKIKNRGLALFFLISTGVTILLMSPLAAPIWQIIPLAMLIQFPWRLLGIAIFTMSVMAGALLSPISDSESPNQSQLYVLFLIVVLASFPYTLPQYTEIPAEAETPLAVVNWDKGSITDRVGMVSVTTQQPHTSPLEPLYLTQKPLLAAHIINGQGTITTLHRGASSQVQVSAPQHVMVQFYTYDYPGWQVTLDDQPIAHRYEPPYGLITVDVPGGDHVLLLQMNSTPIRTIGTIISGLAVLVITFCLVTSMPKPFTSKL